MSSAANHAELKQLERRYAESNARFKVLKAEQGDVNQRLQKEQETLNSLRKQIDRLKQTSQKLIISEHAILRYIERVMKVDLESVKQKILSDSLEASIKMIGSGVFPADTHRVKVHNNVVVTILTDEEE